MDVKKIKDLISDMSVSDKDVLSAAEKIPLETDKGDKEEILALLQEKRPALFRKWQIETAMEFM